MAGSARCQYSEQRHTRVNLVKRIGIFGTSGFAREVGDIARDNGFVPIYIAYDKTELLRWNFDDEVVCEDDLSLFSAIPLAIGIGDRVVRERLERNFRTHQFPNLVHSTATFGYRQRDGIDKARGVIISAGARLTNNIAVGNFAVFDRNSMVGHDSIIGNFAHLAPGACVSGNVHVGAGSWIGAAAVINQGNGHIKLSIGAGTVIGSGAVVIASCEANAVYAGVPAKRIR